MLDTLKSNINKNQADENFVKSAVKMVSESAVEDKFFNKTGGGPSDKAELEQMLEQVPEFQENEELSSEDFADAMKDSSAVAAPLRELIK